MNLQQIETQFKNSLALPAIKNKTQILFCPVGLVGAGKTTVTKPVSEQLNLVRVSSDEVRKLLKENGFDYSSVKEISFRIIDNLVKDGYSVSFDMDCGNPLVKEYAESYVEKYHCKLFFVHIIADEEYIFSKFRNHPPSWLADKPQIMIDNYLVQKEIRLKQNIYFDYFYTIDTSKDTLQQEINACIAKINKTLL